MTKEIFYYSRPGADDVIVLRKELTNTQTMMDDMNKEQEEKYNKLKQEYDQVKTEHNELVVQKILKNYFVFFKFFTSDMFFHSLHERILTR